MKKVIFAAIVFCAAFMIVSCGNYTLSTGLDDQAAVSVVAKDTIHVVVEIDGAKNELTAVKQQDWRRNRNMKMTALNQLKMTPGRHRLVIYNKVDNECGEVVYHKDIFVSTGDHKIIKL